MKELIIEVEDKYYSDKLFPSWFIETDEDRELFIEEYQFTVSELEQDNLEDIFYKMKLEIRLDELNKIAEKSNYKIKLEMI